MNKQLLLLITLVAGSQLLAKTAEERLIEFHTLKDNQKIAWMNFIKESMEQKMDTMRKIHEDWRDFHTTWIKKFWDESDCSKEAKEKLFTEKLDSAIKLHKEHMKMWEEFAKSHHEKATKLCDTNKAAFEKEFGEKKVETEKATPKHTKKTAK